MTIHGTEVSRYHIRHSQISERPRISTIRSKKEQDLQEAKGPFGRKVAGPL